MLALIVLVEATALSALGTSVSDVSRKSPQWAANKKEST